MPQISDEASQKYRISVIERMVEVFALLERSPEGVTIREIVDAVDLSRTTVYRMLNTLAAYDFVHRSPTGFYTLGRRLLTLAAQVAPAGAAYDLIAIAQPHLARLSEASGEGSKLSVLAGSDVLVVAAAQGQGQYSLSATAGQRLPLHAGAAGKVLFAHLPPTELEERLGDLDPLTPATIADPDAMRRELGDIRERGWARDHGEQMVGVHAIAAPITDLSGAAVAALSVPFVAGVEDRRVEEIRRLVIATAKAVSAEVAAAEARRVPEPARPAPSAKTRARSPRALLREA